MASLPRAQIKYIRSLHQKKHRQMYGKFLVEGDKTVRELMHSPLKIDAIYGLSEWVENIASAPDLIHTVSLSELQQLSTHDTPNQAIAIADIPAQNHNATLGAELYIACDQINDPGNAGTIIRIADWFGIGTVIFSENSVDAYNPKVVSAAKGSLFRTQVITAGLAGIFNDNKHLPIYGAAMDGENIYEAQLPAAGILLIGNEANGISHELLSFISHKITIPSFGHAESLNAGVAAGIIVSEWRRRVNMRGYFLSR
jgi:TrmH family RNA methyltransferase